MSFNIIVAIDKKRGIGLKNTIPWYFKDDLKYFKNITLNTIVIMGRNTWESLPKPLAKRYNIVISTTKKNKDGEQYLARSFDDAIEHAKFLKKPIFIIGGSRVYRDALNHKNCKSLYITYINDNYKCDTFFPELPSYYKLNIHNVFSKDLTFTLYNRTKDTHPEKTYLEALGKIITSGNNRADRTKIGTKSLFGMQFRYSLVDSFPLLTTKRMYWKGILEELLWFLKGSTNIQELRDKNVHIWDGNSTREYLDSIGLKNRQEYDGGPIYGFNFRHYGAKYTNCFDNYEGKGYDQVKECLRLIKEEPHSRRIIINLWNPTELKNMVLPPCFLKDTPVLTKTGYKFIQDINDNEYLFTHKNNIEKINKKYITNYSGDIIDLKIQYIPKISATPEHPFYIREVIYKNNPKLKMIKCGEPTWKTAANLDLNCYHGIKINDKSIIPEFTINKKLNGTKTIQITKKLNNKEEWFFMGYYLGDGWSRWDRKGPFCLVFNNKDEEELKNRFSKIFKTCHLKQKQQGCSVYEYHSYIFSHILKQFGRKAHNKVIPNWVLDSPIEYLKEFINGYIRADGCKLLLNNNIHTIITTTSKDIAFKTQLLLLKCNIFSSIGFQKKPKTHIIEGRVVNQRDLYKIDIIYNRKRNIRSFIKDGYAWFPLRDKIVKKVENVNVYNFDVENDHTYIVNNISVHNCHLLYQFYVDGDKLSCSMYQRSGDMGLGVPFNIASASLMTHIFAKLTGKIPYELVHTIGDAHVYNNHIEALKTQLIREPRPFPKLIINNKKKYNKVEDFEYSDFKISAYSCYPSIKMKMAV